MKFLVAVTAPNWFNFLRKRHHKKRFEAVNFWRPSATIFKSMDEGALFLFKLKGSTKIAGGGYFQRNGTAPLSWAWYAFAEANGAETLDELRQLMKLTDTQKQVGYHLLAEPFFFDEDEYIPIDHSLFARKTTSGKYFDSAQPEAWALLQQVQARLSQSPAQIAEPDRIYAESQMLLRPGRRGQSRFRLEVQENYRRCVVTGEHALPVLEAAHIKPHSREANYDLENGLLLRRDVHALFDEGLATVTPDLEFKVSRLLHEEYDNGQAYYQMQRRLDLSQVATMPDKARLEWHSREIYKG